MIFKNLGDINWLRSSLGIPTYSLKSLFKPLTGDSDLNSPRTLTHEVFKETEWIEQCIQHTLLDKYDPTTGITLLIIPTQQSPTGMLYQPSKIFEWIFLPHERTKRVTIYLEKISNHSRKTS